MHLSQRTRKRIKEIFGWLEMVGGISIKPRERHRPANSL